MDHQHYRIIGISLLVVLLLALLANIALAETTAYEIPWWTLDSGGGGSADGTYAVMGTIGQPDTSPLLSGGDYSVAGGFWGAAMARCRVFLPLILR